MIGGGDYVSSGDGLDDCDAHGTLVAGIIAAEPATDDEFSGVAPEATIISIRQSSGAYSATGTRASSHDDDAAVSTGYGTVSTLARAVVRAVDLGASVINISEVACVRATEKFDDRSLEQRSGMRSGGDVVVVAAAGNLSSSPQCQTRTPDRRSPATAGTKLCRMEVRATVASPAWFSPVRAHRRRGELHRRIARGIQCPRPVVGVAAPGTDIVSPHQRRPRPGWSISAR